MLGVGALVAGRYRIVRELGRGAMGVVYVAEHLNTGGLWALKVMLDGSRFSAERAVRFRREARASARIASEHVVKVTDADVAPELGNAPFLVMELLDGEDLERTLEKTGALEPKAALDILKQVARGLDKAHAAGVIHRDLKPENVFLHRREDGSTIVKVLDFGISKILQSERDIMNMSLSSSTDIMGTPLYMAPEQAMAKTADVSPATDVWALGLMTVRLLTNEVYWTGQSIPEIFVQIMTPQRDPPSQRWPQLGPELDAWFAKSTALDPKQRYGSVREQIDELATVLVGERAIGRSVTPAGATDAPAAVASLAPQQPQLRTQRMPSPFNDDGPSMNAVAGTIEPVGAGTDDHVTRVALPMSRTRPVAMIVAAAVVAAGLAIFGFTMLRAPAAQDSSAAATQPPASPSSASLPPAAASLPLSTATPPSNAPTAEPSPPVPPAVASANEPTSKAASASVQRGSAASARGAAVGAQPRASVAPAVAPPGAPAAAASSAAAAAKPAAHQDLFDTQK